jgi:hypothetical protein
MRLAGSRLRLDAIKQTALTVPKAIPLIINRSAIIPCLRAVVVALSFSDVSARKTEARRRIASLHLLKAVN